MRKHSSTCDNDKIESIYGLYKKIVKFVINNGYDQDFPEQDSD